MEIKKLKKCGYELALLFTGSKYILYSEYFGVLAVATRTPAAYEKFVLQYGNEQTVGGSLTNNVVKELMKKEIQKSANKYVKTECVFDEMEDDLSQMCLLCDVR